MVDSSYTSAQIQIPSHLYPEVAAFVARMGGMISSSQFRAPSNNSADSGTMLKNLRQNSGLTQQQISDALGVPQSHISDYENNKRAIPAKHTPKLAALFNNALAAGGSVSSLAGGTAATKAGTTTANAQSKTENASGINDLHDRLLSDSGSLLNHAKV